MTTSPHTERLARFRRACWWLSLGVALLPLKPRSKHLQPGFGPRKARISDVSCARKWFLHTDANLGVLLGPPSGRRYRTLHAAPIAALDVALAGVLFPFLSDRVAPRPSRDARRCRGAAPAGLVDRIKAARSTLAEMRDAGVVLVPGGPNTLVGRCPFHDDHAPSLWLYPDSGVWGCNRPDCRAAGVHDVINFRAFWRRISNRAAIGQLADEFL